MNHQVTLTEKPQEDKNEKWCGKNLNNNKTETLFIGVKHEFLIFWLDLQTIN